MFSQSFNFNELMVNSTLEGKDDKTGWDFGIDTPSATIVEQSAPEQKTPTTQPSPVRASSEPIPKLPLSPEDIEWKPALLSANEFIFPTDGAFQTLPQRVSSKTMDGSSMTEAFQKYQPPANCFFGPPRPPLDGKILKLLDSCSEDDSQYSQPAQDDVTSTRRTTRGRRTRIPPVDLDAISDDEVRRIEKRKAKNRRTAEESRMRKKRKLEDLQRTNEQLTRENQKLRNAILQVVSRGGQGGKSDDSSEPTSVVFCY